MSTYATRRPVRKRRDYVGLSLFGLILLAVPAAGYVAYLFVVDPAQLEAIGLKPLHAQANVAPAAPAADATPAAQATTVATTPAVPAASTPAKAAPAMPASTPTPTQIARVEPPVTPPTKAVDVAPPKKGPGKPTSVAQAVEHIGASIHEALSIPRKVMVVWLVDESNSNADYRRDLRDGLEKMYVGLKQTKPIKDKELDEQPLLSVVAAYGKDIRFATPEPTADANEVTTAVREIVDADNGEENTIKAVSESLGKFLTYRTTKNRHLMFVIVSDEVGDDQAKVDEVIPKLKQYSVPVYTIGVVAPFGSDGQTTQLTKQGGEMLGQPDVAFAKGDFKVIYGPESHDVEWVKLSFPDGGSDFDLGDLDMGPYTLSRLCSESGGEYFALRTRKYEMKSMADAAPRVTVDRPANNEGNKDSYFAALAGAGGSADRPLPKFEDAVVMAPEPKAGTKSPTLSMTPNFKKYAPLYLSEADYQKSITGNKAKQALLTAAKLRPVPCLPSDVILAIDGADEGRKAQAILRAQRPAALVQPQLDELYAELKKGEADSAKLTEPRWQAAFDLAFGRISAAKARADAYMFQLAAIRNGKAATSLQPSDDPIKNSVVDKMAQTARDRLKKVVAEHPGTPWAKAAERELRAPMAFKLVE
ncbi:MAG: VWA domain-containing protein [Planctomycetaceae bacterium]|nr:VWA domain-containing protein [Planctomycetaceae bacterium]